MTPMVVHCDRRTFFKSAALINFYHIDEEDRERERERERESFHGGCYFIT